MMFIARIHVEKGRDDVWDHIVRNYEGMRSEDVTPLYVTQRLSSGETSLIVDAKDTTALADFLLKHLSSMACVQDISVVNLMRPVFFPLPHEVADLKRFTVSVICKSSSCQAAYDALTKLKPSGSGVPTYVALTFMEKGQDMVVSVLSKDLATLEMYIREHITSIEGVMNVSVAQISRTRQLASMFEWKRKVHPITVWENLTSRDYDEKVYKDVIAGC